VSAPAIGRLRVRVEGTVQGVGFRPFVYRLAHEESVTGWVRNDERGVVLEIEGPFPSLERLLARLTGEPPPLAAVDRVAREPVATEDSRTFEIRASTRGDDVDAVIAADSATCADCLRELLDPRDRRYRYPFINCTNCGPRLTIIEGVPYDRAQTTMSTFVMCEACQREYRDPANRRFHAQPNACPVCGPRAELVGATAVDAVDPVDAAAGLLEDGAILAVKGIGGYHLACDARNEAAVRRLRDAKHREEKPFALMVGGVTQARALIAVGAAEERLLASPALPR
jgi:hydrogenase maturation protein HypF